MKFSLKKNEVLNYVYLCIALILAYWVIGAYEVFMSKSIVGNSHNLASTILFKFLNDFLVGIAIAFLFFPFYLFINLWSNKTASIVTYTFFSILILLQFALVKYSLTTLINLGADILGYSYDDAFNTVASSESLSFSYFIPFILFPIVFILLYILIKKYSNHRLILWGGLGAIVIFGILSIFIPDATSESFQNKTAYLAKDLIKFKREQSKITAYNFSERIDYPLLKPFNTPDVLSPFFNPSQDKPNIVVIVVEGLGGEFVDANDYSGFTPYLDQLIKKSLYWENFVSTTGRSFGLLPSLFGSLPYGETGFLEIKNTPSHLSLINTLKANGYFTSFYSGDASSFDRKVQFLEYNGIDNLIDENKYGPEFEKTKVNDGGFSWGYPDDQIFRKALLTQSLEKQPRLDIIMTLSNHEPFEYPNKQDYMTKVEASVNSSNRSETLKNNILNHADIFGSLLYSDESIKDFMEAYSKRPDYENTIFIITGDHRLIPIAMKDKLCRYHVPFIIYSPQLKKAKRFKSIASHLDVTPSLYRYLSNNYKITTLEQTPWIGKGLDTSKNFKNERSIPLMRYKGDINDIIYKEYLLSGNDLYKINEHFETSKVEDQALVQTIKDTLEAFKKTNAYVTQYDKIFPDSLNTYSNTRKKFSEEQLAIINKYGENKNFDEMFLIARDLAFEKKYETANLLCDYILNEYPNYSDVRILKGRMLAWQGEYEEAEISLLNALNRSPYIDDVYMAILDLYWWAEQEAKSKAIYDKAIRNEIENSEISFKMAKAYERLNQKEKAIKLIDSVIQVHKNNPEYIDFKNSLQ